MDATKGEEFASSLVLGAGLFKLSLSIPLTCGGDAMSPKGDLLSLPSTIDGLKRLIRVTLVSGVELEILKTAYLRAGLEAQRKLFLSHFCSLATSRVEDAL